MNQIFVDLLQTPSLVIPLFAFVLIVVAALAYFVWQYIADTDGKKLVEMEAVRMNTQATRLEQFARTGELPLAKTHIDNLNRGAEMPRIDQTTNKRGLPIGLLDTASEYGFEVYASRLTDKALLYDVELPGFDPRSRVYKYGYAELIDAEPKHQQKLLATARTNINRRAKRAGFTPVARKRGRKAVMQK